MRLATRQWYSLARLAAVLVIVLSILAMAACQTKKPFVVDKSQLTINGKGERVYAKKPFTGEAVSYYPSGKLATAEQFKNGRRHGYLKQWFASGVLGYEANFQQGYNEGLAKSWWNNGKLRSQSYYLKGKLDGVAWEWYRTGEKFKRFNYVAGQPSGIQQGWRINGKLFSNFEFRNGRTYGLKRENLCVGLKDEVISLGSWVFICGCAVAVCSGYC
jgi:antitoxin component YwqK of YwqJK toxin-antitoxin module